MPRQHAGVFPHLGAHGLGESHRPSLSSLSSPSLDVPQRSTQTQALCECVDFTRCPSPPHPRSLAWRFKVAGPNEKAPSSHRRCPCIEPQRSDYLPSTALFHLPRDSARCAWSRREGQGSPHRVTPESSSTQTIFRKPRFAIAADMLLFTHSSMTCSTPSHPPTRPPKNHCQRCLSRRSSPRTSTTTS